MNRQHSRTSNIYYALKKGQQQQQNVTIIIPSMIKNDILKPPIGSGGNVKQLNKNQIGAYTSNEQSLLKDKTKVRNIIGYVATGNGNKYNDHQRYHPHSNRPAEFAQSQNHDQKPEAANVHQEPSAFETVFFSDLEDEQQPSTIVEPSPHQGYGGYGPPGVPVMGISLTTTEKSFVVAEEMLEEKEHTFYYVGNKLWYIPLYFSFAFVVYFGYLLIRVEAQRCYNIVKKTQMWWMASAAARSLSSNDTVVAELATTVLSYVEEAYKMYS